MREDMMSWCRRTLSHAIVTMLALLTMAAPTPAAADWGDIRVPTDNPTRVFGGHAGGCIDGAATLPQDGGGYQVMRPSRNRFFGHPVLIAFVQDLAVQAGALGTEGLLIGDLAQPRGGPMTSGHRSHQTGLDVDIWFRFAPPGSFSAAERESESAIPMVLADGSTTDPSVWTERHVALLRAAATDPRVDRIFVNPAIKRSLCASVEGERGWLARIRPWWGHDHHFHVRLTCRAGDGDCRDSPPVPDGDGCDASLDWWFSAEALEELRQSRAKPSKPITLDDLPAACRAVLSGGR